MTIRNALPRRMLLATAALSLPTLAEAGVMSTADKMMDMEASDRVNRFQRLARIVGVTPPVIEQVMVPGSAVGASRPIPVIRVVFDEDAFFQSGGSEPLSSATPVIQVMAENMKRDVPDVRVTLLGHTDALEGDATTTALSRQRAYEVFLRLVHLGVNPGQLGTVAIGKEQPIAPNDTDAGRARNRRVEFLISASEQANLALVSRRPINSSYFRTGPDTATVAPPSTPARVEFLKPTIYKGPADFSEAPVEQRKIEMTEVKPITLSGAKEGPAR